MIARLPVLPFTACESCRAPCCLGSVVYVNSLDVYRIASTVGLDWPAFSVIHPTAEVGFIADGAAGRGPHGVRLRRRQDSTACELSVVTPDGTLRCGVYGMRPAACRIYPYHVQAMPQQPYQVAMGNNAACPTLAINWFNRNVDPLGDLVDEAVADATLADRVEARWNDVVTTLPEGAAPPIAFLRWAWDFYAKLGSPPTEITARSEWQLAAYRALAATGTHV